LKNGHCCCTGNGKEAGKWSVVEKPCANGRMMEKSSLWVGLGGTGVMVHTLCAPSPKYQRKEEEREEGEGNWWW